MPSGDRRRPHVIVFAGPSLFGIDDDTRQQLLDGVTLWPPVRRGDVLTALSCQPDVIAIIDGYFFDEPAVTHKEIAYAIETGVTVIGGASLGALRAVELATVGMRGVGWVFEQYRDEAIDDDGEVAVLHATAEHGYRPLSVALVDVRHALQPLHCPIAAATRLIDTLSSIGFVDRDMATVADLARQCLPDGLVDAFVATLRAPGIKTTDAIATIEAAKHAPTRGLGSTPSASSTLTTFTSAHRARAWRAVGETWPLLDAPTWASALAAVQGLHAQAPALVDHVRTRYVYAHADRLVRPDPPPGLADVASELDTALRRHAGGATLPKCELLDEAELIARARRAHRTWSSHEQARQVCAQAWEASDSPQLIDAFVRYDPDAVGTWSLTRALICGPACAVALRTATAVEQIHRCFLRWAQDRAAPDDAVDAFACRLWHCEPASLADCAEDRGLLGSNGVPIDMREVLRWLMPAEQLSPAINDYPEHRDTLRSVDLLDDPLL